MQKAICPVVVLRFVLDLGCRCLGKYIGAEDIYAFGGFWSGAAEEMVHVCCMALGVMTGFAPPLTREQLALPSGFG